MHDTIGTAAGQARASIARALFEAYQARRREDVEALLSADFTFTSPYDDAIGRKEYFERCWPNGDRFVEFAIERVASDAQGAFVTYRCMTEDGKSFTNTEYLRIEGSQVTSVNVYFGATYRSGEFVPQQIDSK